MNDTPFQELPTYTQRSSSKGKVFLLIFVIIVILAALCAGGYYFFLKGNKFSLPVMPIPYHSAPTAMPAPKITIMPTPIASPTASLKRSDLSLSVLNGSGVPGAAKQIATQLTTLGYNVTNTDNADNFNYKNVTIEIKSADSNYLPLLKSDILANSSVPITTKIDDTISTDAVVIVGK